MNKYVIAVFPNFNSAGTKMSRDIEIIAENDQFAKEQAQSMYPDARIMIRRSVRIASSSSTSENSSRYVNTGSGLNMGGRIGVFLGDFMENMGFHRQISALGNTLGVIVMITSSVWIGLGIAVFFLAVAYYVNHLRGLH